MAQGVASHDQDTPGWRAVLFGAAAAAVVVVGGNVTWRRHAHFHGQQGCSGGERSGSPVPSPERHGTGWRCEPRSGEVAEPYAWFRS
ncbi:hypothetical protein [Terriglobus sp. RCC_193]|uniref:hypothetical protein n=1 Tax=Terriglobus sp. RCC_193 TaxID=3239218 RepID=UPI003523E772